MIRPAPPPAGGRAGAPPPETGENHAGGLRCRVCGLDEVPWPRTAYCSERCRRRAAYLARKRRPDATGHPPAVAPATRRTES